MWNYKETNMKNTFKDFLITEAANTKQLKQVENDRHNLIGVEFEYFDNNISGQNGVNYITTLQQYIYDYSDDIRDDVKRLIKHIKSKISEEHLDDMHKDMDRVTLNSKANRDAYNLDLDMAPDFVGDDDYNLKHWLESYPDFKSKLVKPKLPLPTTGSDFDIFFSNEDLIDTFSTINYESPHDYINIPEDFDIEELDDDNFNNEINDRYNFEEFPFPDPLIGKTSKTRWGIVPDGSLPLKDGGVEVVSPVMVLKDGLNAINKMFEYIKDNGYTSTKPPTGLHINASYKKFNIEQLDIVKMIMFSDEKHIKKLFPDRTKNSMVRFLQDELESNAYKIDIKSILNQLKDDPNSKQSYNTLRNYQKNIIKLLLPDSQKWNAINFTNAFGKDGRVEFRYLGDKGYEQDFPKIKRAILHFYHMLKLGVDPEYMKTEYLQKLKKLDKLSDNINQDKFIASRHNGAVIGVIGGDIEVLKSNDNNSIFLYNIDDEEITNKMTYQQFRRDVIKNKGKYRLYSTFNINNPQSFKG